MNELSVHIESSGRVTLCGENVAVSLNGRQMLVELYRNHVGDYPKFFKMDTMSRLAFIASELLLNKEEGRFVERDDRAVIFGGVTDCTVQDEAYRLSYCDKDNYFPSPALFVYTLPNIASGEVAIRNRYLGETMYFAAVDEAEFEKLCRAALCGRTNSVLAAWIEVKSADNFSCSMKVMHSQHNNA